MKLARQILLQSIELVEVLHKLDKGMLQFVQRLFATEA